MGGKYSAGTKVVPRHENVRGFLMKGWKPEDKPLLAGEIFKVAPPGSYPATQGDAHFMMLAGRPGREYPASEFEEALKAN